MTQFPAYFVLFLLTLACGPAAAQVGGSRIGILGAPEEPRFSEIVAGLTRGLREHGYTDKTIEIIQGRVPRGDNASERAVVEKMVQRRIQVLFAWKRAMETRGCISIILMLHQEFEHRW